MKIRFEFSQDPKEFGDRFRELAATLRDFRPVWHMLLPVLAREAVRAIETQGASIGASWPALKPDTLRRKQGKRSMLIESGRLLAAMGNANVGKRKLTKSLVFYGPPRRLPWGGVHEMGSRKQKIPQREFVGISEVTRSAAIQLAQQYIEHSVREAER